MTTFQRFKQSSFFKLSSFSLRCALTDSPILSSAGLARSAQQSCILNPVGYCCSALQGRGRFCPCTQESPSQPYEAAWICTCRFVGAGQPAQQWPKLELPWPGPEFRICTMAVTPPHRCPLRHPCLWYVSGTPSTKFCANQALLELNRSTASTAKGFSGPLAPV